MKHLALFLGLSALQVAHGVTGTVQSVMFKASVTPPTCQIPAALKHREALFREGLRTLPEGLLVAGALTIGGGELGLTTNQSTNLAPLVWQAYAKIAADPAFARVPSALPYCFSETPPSRGQYFLYRPERLPEKPRCIVFLHGYGGNFQFYTWVLKEEFPDAVILAPSWSLSWHRGSAVYLKEMIADAEKQVGVPLDRPWLMGISAGGRGGFTLYNQMADRFRGYVCIANAPESAVTRNLRGDLRILMLNGTQDDMVPLPIARQQAVLAKRRVPGLVYRELQGNHFFLLSDRLKTFGEIRAFMEDSLSAGP